MLHVYVERFNMMSERGNILGWDGEWNKAKEKEKEMGRVSAPTKAQRSSSSQGPRQPRGPRRSSAAAGTDRLHPPPSNRVASALFLNPFEGGHSRSPRLADSLFPSPHF
jgi:hypothetical protein